MTVRRLAALGVVSSLFVACASSGPDGAVSTSPVSSEVSTSPVSSEVSTSLDAEAKDVVTRSSDAEGDGVRPQGLSTVTARITSVDGEICEVCMWLADSPAERATGLMGVTDLGGPVGMAFSWSEPTDGRFFMLNTPTPLSIAWFADSGEHVGQTDMTPCLTDDSETCDRYGADAAYTLAIEMFEGQLGKVGITPGARVELLAGTESPTCSIAG
jgi:uncharacterized membrane protein (UPF0127 family)